LVLVWRVQKGVTMQTQTYLTYGALVIVGFLIGFVPMWIASRRSSGRSARNLSEATDKSDLAQTQNALASSVAEHQLGLATLQNTLASAVVDAHRGDYESARTATSSFFTSLRAETNKRDDSSLSQAQKEGVEPLLARRDDTIALLARNDPASTERLSDLYVAFREVMNKVAVELKTAA